MSMTTPDGIQLPPGWSIAGWRETSQQNAAGQIVQGVVFTLTKLTGGNTSVFIQNALLGQTAAIQDAFNQRIDALTAITG
jgi:hypothetical protein